MATQKKHLTGGAQKHMEIMSVQVLVHLREKSHELCMRAILNLPQPQIQYIC